MSKSKWQMEITPGKVTFCHPELVSGSQILNLSHDNKTDAETILNQVQHKVQHDIVHYFENLLFELESQ